MPHCRKRARFERCLPIQKYGLPIIYDRRDVRASAETRSGKTLAFLLPIIAHCLSKKVRTLNFEMLQHSIICYNFSGILCLKNVTFILHDHPSNRRLLILPFKSEVQDGSRSPRPEWRLYVPLSRDKLIRFIF